MKFGMGICVWHLKHLHYIELEMKKYLVLILAIVVSCGKKDPKPPVDLKHASNRIIQEVDSAELAIKNATDKYTTQPQYNPLHISDDIVSNESNKPNCHDGIIKTKKFYNNLLNEFCKKYYSRKFKGTTYIIGSLTTERVTKEDENSVEVKGFHSFKGLIKTFDQRDFVATIRDYGNFKYSILFRRRGWVTGQWKDTGNITFLYNPDE